METHGAPYPLVNSTNVRVGIAGSEPTEAASLASVALTIISSGLSRLALPLGTAGIVLTAFLVYLPSLDDFFVADDFVFLQAANRHDVGAYLRRAVTFPNAQPFDLETPF